MTPDAICLLRLFTTDPSLFVTGKNRKRFFRYRAPVAGGESLPGNIAGGNFSRGFCRLARRVATP
jgi:hypothetical protein